MRYYLRTLLEALEKSYPNGLTVSKLREKFSSDIDDTIHDAVRGHLVLYPIYHPGGNFGAGDKIYLDVNGFGLLNQMKMKEAVDQLDVSIKGFNASSDKSYEKIIDLTDKLGLSVEKLYKSSERLELLTLALTAITVFLAMIAVIELVKDFIPKFVVYILAFVFLASISYIIYILTKVGNEMISKK